MIDKLEFFIAVAREHSFRRAAESCGVAQPTLSAAIKQLEESLGVMLVRRNARFQGLTPEGERVLEWANRLVGDARAMRDEVRLLKRGLSGHLRIAVIPTAVPFTPLLTRAYHVQHPGVRITTLSRSSAEILDLVNNLEVDAGITYLGNEPIGRLRAVPLYVERYRLLTTPHGPLGQADRASWAEVGRIPLCLLTPDMQNRRIIDRFLRLGGVEIGATLLEADTVIGLLAHVQTGQWATIVSERTAACVIGAQALRAIPLVEPEAKFQVGLVLPDRTPMTSLLQALLTEAERLSKS